MALSNVEELRPLLAFVQMISDPDAFAETLKRVETDLAQYDKMMKVYPTVKAADSYFAQAKKYVEESNAIIAGKQNEFDMARSAWLQDKAAQETALDEQRQAVMLKATELREREKLLAGGEHTLEVNTLLVEGLKQDVSNEKATLEKLNADLKLRITRLDKASAALETV